MWCEKLSCAIVRGVFDVGELEKLEAEEAVRVGVSGFEMLLVYLSSSIDGFLAFVVDWSFIPPISPFFSGLFADLGILDIVETPPDIQSGS